MMIAATIVSWLVGVAFLVLTFRAIHKDKGAIASAWGFITAFFMLCGMPWFQGLAKTWIVSNVGARLAALSRQMDDVQVTTAKMQSELSDHQTLIDKHQKELADQQGRIRTAQTNVANQQESITNQYDQIAQLQAKLALAQTNIAAQQTALSDVSYWVNNLYANTVSETVFTGNTNKVIVNKMTNGLTIVCILGACPHPAKHTGYGYFRWVI